MSWSIKQIQFYHAMVAYEQQPIYAWLTRMVAILNIGLQWLLLVWVWQASASGGRVVLMAFLAFVAADFVNGLVHLWMDHYDDYTSNVGPLVAAFHLHHDTPRYQDKPIWRVYIDESGSKIWLLVVLCVAVLLQCLGLLSDEVLIFLAFFALCSSVAEVSHFLCHNSGSAWVRVLQRYKVLLPREHHMQHHRLDNINYAFLNGMTDPLINVIARRFFKGYHASTDQHTAMYQHLNHT